MLKSGTWPGNVAVGPLSDMDSSGSCDSVISTNSGCSDDSMEHLTPEERACLMFLEETIEALEVEEDSGLSTDEPDLVTKAKDQIRVNGISSLVSQSDSLGMPTPPSPAAADPAHMTFTPQGETEHHAPNQNSEPQSAPSSPLLESAPGCTTPSAANQTEATGLTLNGACDPESVTSTWTCSDEETSEIDLSIFPPPSDFKDDLDPDSLPEELNDVPAPPEFSTEPEPHVEPVQLNSTDSVDKISETSSLTEDPPPSLPANASGSLSNPPPEFTPPRSPPPVAPKPKKLPGNIVLPSQKAAAGSSDGSVRPLPTSSDRLMEDHRKVHTEALRKLGLLKEKQEETSLVRNPNGSKYRRSWNGPSPPLTPSYTHLSSPLQTSPSPQFVPSAAALPAPPPPPPPPTQDPVVLPVPTAFCDSIRPLPSLNKLPAGADVPDAAASIPAPASVQQLTSPKVTDKKSAAPQPPAVGLSFHLTGPNPDRANQRAIGEQSPQPPLSSRPRPASPGSRRDVPSAKGEDVQAAPTASKQLDAQRAPHAHNVLQQSRESSKLPRSQGISVLICPRPENVEGRREALKKLGLLRD
ncbi:specifically androgen-regulated gene protein [Austrofundulus limnaeus]|uniref:Specifically androgen-regulated gene protein n=1 Tax=Austrofundulus limnaeus TaxID=52670 RepID=A0A2I4CES6_AUSLI|nr:PREDICTED: specifically androgen-regulated gene protein-like [Austrofundulus limnaeus]